MDDEKLNLKLKSFDLGEVGGGSQIIIDYKAISPNEYVVMTVGNGAKIPLLPDSPAEKAQTEGSENTSEAGNIKIRFFKLTMLEGNACDIAEYVTVDAICEAARLFKKA